MSTEESSLWEGTPLFLGVELIPIVYPNVSAGYRLYWKLIVNPHWDSIYIYIYYFSYETVLLQPIGTVASKLRESVGHINEDNAEENSSASSSSSEEDKPGVGHADRRSSGRTSGESRSSSIGSSRVAMRRATVKRAPNRASCHQQNGTASVEPLQIKAPGRAAEVSHLTDAMQKLGLRGTTINNNSTTTALRFV